MGRGRGQGFGSDRRLDLQPVRLHRLYSFDVADLDFSAQLPPLRRVHLARGSASSQAASRPAQRCSTRGCSYGSYAEQGEPTFPSSPLPKPGSILPALASTQADSPPSHYRAPRFSASSPSTPSSPPTSVPRSSVTASPSTSSPRPQQGTPPARSTTLTTPLSSPPSDSTTRTPSNASFFLSVPTPGWRDATLPTLLPRRPRALSPRAFGRSNRGVTLSEREIKRRMWGL